MKNYTGKKIVILGAARQGQALARFFTKRDAQVILTDSREKEQLSEELAVLENLPISLDLGGHHTEILDGADLVCVSGGVPVTIPFIQEALIRHIPLSNDSQIFLEECPCMVAGITGSAGKSTTTALAGLIAKTTFEMKSNRQKAWVGGNIGNPLIDYLDEIKEDDLAIMELSSFQLELMQNSPQIAAVLNISPNHLDRHGSMDAYIDAKSHILWFQHADDIAVLNRDNKASWDLLREIKGELISFGLNKPDSRSNGTYVDQDSVWLQIGKEKLKMFPVEWIQLRGRHNLYNVLAASAIAAAATLALPAIQSAVEEFQGIPHRLETVRELDGVTWINDSIATAPERTMAAIESISEPIVLLLGGRDKNLPWDKLAAVVRNKIERVIVFGEAAPIINEAIGTRKHGQYLKSVVITKDLAEALKTAKIQAQPGEVVLLSPGGTSYDAFKDFEERGQFFRDWVNQL
ncbi:MAG TPA: UDP-N-acetylmuramoyl-L-alanine--D-glutamate ligase [Anaerolineaceae bacterium]|jgi:UDP-N-acetylmuramoylalanine--D-glutamate ligase|nr:UDP-N-acetylmuramoyl-L-alanine--D-glutamate ligase [Anaerolineaceae bacterium]